METAHHIADGVPAVLGELGLEKRAQAEGHAQERLLVSPIPLGLAGRGRLELEGKADGAHEAVERPARAGGGEPLVGRHAHLGQGAHIAALAVGGDRRPLQRAARHGAPGVGDPHLAAAGRHGHRVAPRVDHGGHADPVRVHAGSGPVAPARGGAWKTRRPRVIARKRVGRERLIGLHRAARARLEGRQHRRHHLEEAVAHREACLERDTARGGVAQRGAREHRLGVARPGRRGQLGGAKHPPRRGPEAAAAPAAEPPLRPVGISTATASSSSPSISSRSSGRIAPTIAPYPNLSSTSPPIARLLTIRGYGPVGTEDAISGLTQPRLIKQMHH